MGSASTRSKKALSRLSVIPLKRTTIQEKADGLAEPAGSGWHLGHVRRERSSRGSHGEAALQRWVLGPGHTLRKGMMAVRSGAHRWLSVGLGARAALRVSTPCGEQRATQGCSGILSPIGPTLRGSGVSTKSKGITVGNAPPKKGAAPLAIPGFHTVSGKDTLGGSARIAFVRTVLVG